MKRNFKKVNSPRMVDRVGTLNQTTTIRRSRLRRARRKDHLRMKMWKIKRFLLNIGDNFIVHPSWESNLNFVFDRLEHVFGHNGPDYAASWMKRSRLAFTRYVTGYPLTFMEDLYLTKRGLPFWLDSRISKGELSDEELRMWLTLLSMSRAITSKPKLDVDSIITPSEYTDSRILDSEIDRACKELNVRKRAWEWSKYHLTTKSGPNGQALVTCINDLNRLPLRLKDALLKVGGELFRENIKWLRVKGFLDFWNTSYPSKNKNRYRKLSFFADKECKTRVIAIMDYWTQTVLRPLHDTLNGFLRGIKTDCTYNQDHFRSLLKSGPFYSLDLKSATDRMPVAFQRRILKRIVGDELAKTWAEILSDFPFESDAGKVKYLAGQPMGAYSSWPAMALTHHIIVRISANRVGCSNFINYAILGDDIVIADRAVAESYKEVLKVLDMPISEQKTHVSEDTYEFAKRWVRRGVEVSPFPVSGLLETWNSYPLFQNFLETQLRKGWVFRDSRGPGHFLEDIMCSCGRWSQASRTSKLLNIFSLLKAYIVVHNFDNEDLKCESNIPSRLWDIVAPLEDKPSNLVRWLDDLLGKSFLEQCKKDNDKLQHEAIDYMNLTVRKMIDYAKAKSLQAPETNRLWAVFLKRHPIPQLFRDRMNYITEQMEEIRTEKISYYERFTSQVIMNKFWTKDIFSMRQSNSQIFAQARIVKDFLSAARPDTSTTSFKVDRELFLKKLELFRSLKSELDGLRKPER